MARPEQIEQLDRQIAAAVKRAVQDFQDELSMRIRSATSEITRLVEETTLSLPPAYVTAQDLEPLEPEARPEPRTLGSGELLAAARHLDSARTQAGVLTALLEAAGGFSARAAVFLTRGEDVRGWRGDGFGDDQDLGALTFDLGESPWNDLASGTGCVPLSAGDCARITSRLDVPLAQGGTLIPLVLRDQVAAALYADRSESSHWNLEALQVLTHLAALAVETLPFRARAQTPTLVEIGGAGDGLPIWTGAPETASEWTHEPEEMPAIEEDFGEPATDYAAEATAATSPAPEASDFGRSAPVSPWGEPDFQDAPAAAAPEPAPARRWYQLAQPEAADAAAVVPVLQPPAQESTDAYWRVEESAPVEVEESPEPASAAPVEEYEPVARPEPPPLPPTPAAPWYAPPPPMPPPLPAPATGGALSTVAIPAPFGEDDATLMLQRPGFQEPIAPPPPVPPMPPMPPTPTAPEAPRYGDADEPTHPGLASGRSQTSPIAIPPPRTWQPGETAEVAPPPDVEGPGWAFASKPVSASPNAPDDAPLHDEARRLARLLVSEIKLYNEERVEEGRRNKDIYERLKEDIDRSRQMYEERVDARILRSTDYFYQELVRILAAGDARALGI